MKNRAHVRWVALGALFLVISLAITAAWLTWPGKEAARTSAPPETTSPVASTKATWSPADPVAKVTGKVLETDGRPIPSATVCAWFEGPESRAPSCATSSSTGEYELARVKVDATFKVGAAASRHAPSTFDERLRLREGETRSGVDVVLRSGGVAVRGRVKDAFGGAVVGAAIVVTLDEDHAAVATSDPRGDFVAWIEPGYLHVKVTAVGYAEASATDRSEHYFDIALLPGAVVVGRAVERANGAPVANARIDAVAVDDRGRHSVRSKDDGTFRFEGLTPGRYHLEGLAHGLSGYSRAPVLVGLAETSSEVLVELDRSPPVTAKVLESRSRAPCTHGDVTLQNERLREFAQAPIEADGSVHLIGVLPGTYKVEVDCDGHLSKKEYSDITVADRALEGIVWEVERGAEARGVVVDADGRPAANVRVHGDPEEQEAGRPSTSTDAKGAFVLRGLSQGKYKIVATSSTETEAETAVEVSGRDLSGLRIALGRGANIEGNVVDTDGKPVSGTSVVISGPTSRRIVTREDGTFLASGLLAGEYKIRARNDGLRVGFTSSEPSDLALAPGATAKKTLTVERRAGFVEGQVVDARGEPLPDFFVETAAVKGRFSRWGSSNRVVTDARGHFRIDRLGDGEVVLRAFRPGGSEAILQGIKVGSTNIMVKIGGTGILTGTVIAPRNARPDRFTIQVSDPESGFSRSESTYHANGSFTMRELPAGTFTITIEAPEGTGTAEVTIVAGATATVTIDRLAQPEP